LDKHLIAKLFSFSTPSYANVDRNRLPEQNARELGQANFLDAALCSVSGNVRQIRVGFLGRIIRTRELEMAEETTSNMEATGVSLKRDKIIAIIIIVIILQSVPAADFRNSLR